MHKLDKHYSDFGGLDTRSNKLLENPRTARGGTNFQFSFQDEWTKRHGFQHKRSGTGCEAALMEYKYKDVNTGESLTKILGIDSSGNLNLRRVFRLKLTKAGGTVDHYSFFYNEVSLNFEMTFYNVANAVLATVTVALVDTIITLKNNINTLALAGLTADVVNESGTSVPVVGALAYTLDWVVDSIIPTGDSYNEIWFWEQVPTSSSQVPFPNVVAQAANEDYQGPTWINQNNSIFITDGGFPMKYDGTSVYRSGMPKITFQNGAGFQAVLEDSAGPAAPEGLTPNSEYKYIKQLCFVDVNGVEVCGAVQPLGYYDKQLPVGKRAIYVPIFPVGNTDVTNELFPIFSCEVNGDQTITGTGSKTLTVTTGHNVKVGQCLRVPIMNTSNGLEVSGGLSWAYYAVTAVTATTITFNKTQAVHYMPQKSAIALEPVAVITLNNTAGAGDDGKFKDDLIINACYVPDDWSGKITDPYNGTIPAFFEDTLFMDWAPTPIYGAFCRIFRTKAGGSLFYRLFDAPVAHFQTTSNDIYTILDTLADDNTSGTEEKGLTTIPYDSAVGAEIPRACSVLSSWQDTLIQTVRPIDPTGIIGFNYPNYDGTTAQKPTGKWTPGLVLTPWLYSEANLTDFQSIYWADVDNTEGFPVDGLHEFLIETRFNDSLIGVSPNKDSFFCFKNKSLGYLTGTVATNNISLEILESDNGTASHKCIQQVQGTVFFMDAESGFWSVVAGRLPVPIGYPLCDFFKKNVVGSNFTKSVATNFRKDDKYICYIPGDVSQMFIYDYAQTQKGFRSCWYPWNGVEAAGGILATADNQLLLSDSSGSKMLWKQKFTETAYDYSDHTSAIAWEYLSAWINFAMPVIDKKFVKVWINSIQGDFSIVVSQYGNYLDPSIGDFTLTMLPDSSTKKAVKDYVGINVDKLSGFSLGMGNNVIYDDVRIQGWELEFAPDFDPEEGRK